MSCCEDPPVADNAASAYKRTVYSYSALPRPGVFSRLLSANDASKCGRLHMRLTAGQTAWWNRRYCYRYSDRKQYRCI